MYVINNFDKFKQYNESKKYYDSQINEGIFGLMGKLFKNIFNKTKEAINKTKGGKELEEIYQKYIKILSDKIKEKTNIELNIAAASNIKQEKVSYYKYKMINEDEEKDIKTEKESITPDKLKQSNALIDKIIDETTKMAIDEMNNIITKLGGKEKNPKLQLLVNAKISQLKLDVLNAKYAAISQSGDQKLIAEIETERKKITQEIENNLKKIESIKEGEGQITPEIIEEWKKDSKNVIYLRDGVEKKEWDDLSDEDKKNPEKHDKIVGVKPILRHDDKYIWFKTDDGKEFSKPYSDIIGISNKEDITNDNKENEITKEIIEEWKKDSKNVIYLRDGVEKKEWDDLSDEDKKNPEKHDKIVGVKPILRVEGDSVWFKTDDGKEFSKPYSDIIGIVKK
jgi:hypothetical protein